MSENNERDVQMEKETGFAYQVLVLVIILIIAIAGVIINKIIGKDGMVNKVVEVETEFSKEDILEKINYKVTQKFIELNNQANQNHQNILEIYNENVVIEFLKQNEIIHETFDESGNLIDNVFEIDISKLTDEEKSAVNIGKFQLEKIENEYVVVYYDENGETEQIGKLQIQQM